MSEHMSPIPSMIYNAAVGGHVTNSQQIIDENLNREQQDINEEVAAVPYNATTPNGMGKIVLKKTDNFKEVVEAQTNGNTIFVIKYDFTLTGNVTVPANCILDFDGGSIANASGNSYTITGDNTGIKAGLVKIFNTNVTFAGSWNIPEVFPDWFGVVYNNSSANNRQSLQKAVDLSRYSISNKVKVLNGDIWIDVIDTPILEQPLDNTINNGIVLYSNCNIEFSPNTYIRVKPNTSIQYALIDCTHLSNVIIEGGHLIGDVEEHDGSTGEWGYGIRMIDTKDSVIRNIETSYFWGDGIVLSDTNDSLDEGNCKNIDIDNVKALYNRRNNISITGATGVKVKNTELAFAGAINGTAPKAGIDIEPWPGAQKCSNIILENCNIHDNTEQQLMLTGSLVSNEINLSDVIIDKCSVRYSQYDISAYSYHGLWLGAKNVMITNCDISMLHLYYSNNVRVDNTKLGRIRVQSNNNILNVVDTIISNCVIYNQYNTNNTNSTLFEINDDVEDMLIHSCVLLNNTLSSKPNEVITFGGDVADNKKKNVKFLNNSFKTKYPFSFNGASDLSNLGDFGSGTSPQNSLLVSGQGLYTYFINGDNYSGGGGADYKVEIKLPKTPNQYDVFIEPSWTNIQHKEFSKFSFITTYTTVELIDFIDGENFIPISYTSDDTWFYITFVKKVASTNLRFFASILSRKLVNISYSVDGYSGSNRQIMNQKYSNAVSGSSRPTVSTIGYCFFDSSIGTNGKPIWYAGNNIWVDATGATI